MKRTTLNWLRSSEYDIKTAESLLRARRYVYVIFMCHLAVEKTLKAVISETSRTTPPRTHNLYRLLELGRIQLPEVHEAIVAQLNTMSTATRYPEDIAALEAGVTGRSLRPSCHRRRSCSHGSDPTTDYNPHPTLRRRP
jgi:HEPN domain-containing protein